MSRVPPPPPNLAIPERRTRTRRRRPMLKQPASKETEVTFTTHDIALLAIAIADRLELSLEGQRRHYQWARNYGKTKDVKVRLGADQLAALELITPWASTSEHIRRAVDLYLTRFFG